MFCFRLNTDLYVSHFTSHLTPEALLLQGYFVISWLIVSSFVYIFTLSFTMAGQVVLLCYYEPCGSSVSININATLAYLIQAVVYDVDGASAAKKAREQLKDVSLKLLNVIAEFQSVSFSLHCH